MKTQGNPRKPCDEEELSKTLKPFFFISAIYGQTPFSFVFPNTIFKFPLPQIIYQVFVFSFSSIMAYQHLYNLIFEMTASNVSIEKYWSVLMVHINTTTANLVCAFMTLTWKYRNNMNKFITTLEIVDRIIYKKCNSRNLKIYLWILAIIFTLGGWILCAFQVYHFKTSVFAPLECIAMFVNHTPLPFLGIHFTTFVYLLRQRFRNMNSNLEDLVLQKQDLNVDLVNKLSRICDVHALLVDATTYLNSAYDIQMLMLLGKVFTALTSDVYCVLNGLRVRKPQEIIPLVLSWDMFWIMLVTLSLGLCGSVSKEAARTAFNLRRLVRPSHWPDGHRRSHRVGVPDGREARRWAAEMAADAKEAAFSACGLFPLDFSLLCAMGQGVACYVIILLQFDSQETGCDSAASTALPLDGAGFRGNNQ